MMRLIFQIALFCLALAGGAPLALGDKWMPQASQSTVYIFYDVTDPGTGTKTSIRGTGFVVSRLGYVLTVAHLLRDWNKQSESAKALNPIKASLGDKPGYVSGSPLNLAVIDPGNPATVDVALLKLPDPDRNSAQGYPPAPICMSSPHEAWMGDQFYAYGFPLDQNIQPVAGILGTKNADGGRWAAAAAFAEGMSGGPVYDTSGNLIGLVKGGLTNTEAVRWITPIRHAENLLRIAGVSQECMSIDNIANVNITIVSKSIPERLDAKTATKGAIPINQPFSPAKIETSVVIRVVDLRNGTPISNASVTITYRKSGKPFWNGKTDMDGELPFPLSDEQLRIRVKDSSHQESSANLYIPNPDRLILIAMADRCLAKK